MRHTFSRSWTQSGSSTRDPTGSRAAGQSHRSTPIVERRGDRTGERTHHAHHQFVEGAVVPIAIRPDPQRSHCSHTHTKSTSAPRICARCAPTHETHQLTLPAPPIRLTSWPPSDKLRNANVASHVALDPPALPKTKKCGQFQNRQGLRKAVLPRSVLSCSTPRASRTIEHRGRRGHGCSSFTMALAALRKPARRVDAWSGSQSASVLMQDPRFTVGTRQWSRTQVSHLAVSSHPRSPRRASLFKSASKCKTKRDWFSSEIARPRCASVLSKSTGCITTRLERENDARAERSAANVARSKKKQRRATTFRHRQRQ